MFRHALVALLSVGVLASACAPAPVTPDPEPKAEAAPVMEESKAAPTKTADGRARAFIGLLDAGRFGEAEAELNEAMSGALGDGKLAQLWQGLVGQVGALEAMPSHEVVEKQGYRIVLLTCRFEAAALQFTISYDGDDKVAGFFVKPAPVGWSPPSYAKPEAFTEREVTVGEGEWALPGTLSMPKDADGAVPALVLVHGSGPNDRDETVGGTKVFKDLAWGLASRGVAVLRFEKRTRHHAKKFTPEVLASLTMKEETVDDAVAAAAFLRTVDGIDARRIFVAGHSQGGSAMPRIARADKELAGFVIMAGRTRAWPDVVLAQVTYILGLDGDSPEDAAKLDALKVQVERARALKPGDTAPAEELPLGIHAAFLLDIQAHPHEVVLKGEMRPMLVLQGERDYQVTMEDFAGWKKLLAGRPAVTFKSYPAGNHLFVDGGGPSTPAEYQTPANVAEVVVADIAAFILGR